MIKNLLKTLFLFTLLVLFVENKVKAQCTTTPVDQDFSGFTDDTYTKNTITLNCIKYTINGDGAIAVQDKEDAYVPTPAFTENILLFTNSGTSNFPTQCQFETTNTAVNFKLKSFAVEFYDHGNGGAPQLYNIVGYDNGVEKVRLNSFNTKVGGAQGSGNATITFAKNAFNQDGSTSGVLSFGIGWQNIDKVVFEVAETNDAYKYLFVAIDNLDFEPAVEGTLPVTLNGFDAIAENNAISLNWKTSSETGNDGFIIEHSLDGVDYKELTRVEAKGNGTINSYSYGHTNPNWGINYYKLRQIDFNGTINDLAFKSVSFKLANNDLIVFYPNPTHKELAINIKEGKFDTAEIISLDGKVLVKKDITKSQSSLSINVSFLQKGNYVLVLKGDGKVVKRKITKI